MKREELVDPIVFAAHRGSGHLNLFRTHSFSPSEVTEARD